MPQVTYAWAMKSTSWHHFVYWFMSLDSAFALIMYPVLAILHTLIYLAVVGCSRRKEAHLDEGGCCCACLYGKNCLKDDDDGKAMTNLTAATIDSPPSDASVM